MRGAEKIRAMTAAADSIEWVDAPPPSQRGKGSKARESGAPWVALALALASRPGRWAKARSGPPRKEAITARNCLTNLGVKVTVRGPNEGPRDIYAQWPGDGAA